MTLCSTSTREVVEVTVVLVAVSVNTTTLKSIRRTPLKFGVLTSRERTHGGKRRIECSL